MALRATACALACVLASAAGAYPRRWLLPVGPRTLAVVSAPFEVKDWPTTANDTRMANALTMAARFDLSAAPALPSTPELMTAALQQRFPVILNGTVEAVYPGLATTCVVHRIVVHPSADNVTWTIDLAAYVIFRQQESVPAADAFGAALAGVIGLQAVALNDLLEEIDLSHSLLLTDVRGDLIGSGVISAAPSPSPAPFTALTPWSMRGTVTVEMTLNDTLRLNHTALAAVVYALQPTLRYFLTAVLTQNDLGVAPQRGYITERAPNVTIERLYLPDSLDEITSFNVTLTIRLEFSTTVVPPSPQQVANLCTTALVTDSFFGSNTAAIFGAMMVAVLPPERRAAGLNFSHTRLFVGGLDPVLPLPQPPDGPQWWLRPLVHLETRHIVKLASSLTLPYVPVNATIYSAVNGSECLGIVHDAVVATYPDVPDIRLAVESITVLRSTDLRELSMSFQLRTQVPGGTVPLLTAEWQSLMTAIISQPAALPGNLPQRIAAWMEGALGLGGFLQPTFIRPTLRVTVTEVAVGARGTQKPSPSPGPQVGGSLTRIDGSFGLNLASYSYANDERVYAAMRPQLESLLEQFFSAVHPPPSMSVPIVTLERTATYFYNCTLVTIEFLARTLYASAAVVPSQTQLLQDMCAADLTLAELPALAPVTTALAVPSVSLSLNYLQHFITPTPSPSPSASVAASITPAPSGSPTGASTPQSTPSGIATVSGTASRTPSASASSSASASASISAVIVPAPAAQEQFTMLQLVGIVVGAGIGGLCIVSICITAAFQHVANRSVGARVKPVDRRVSSHRSSSTTGRPGSQGSDGEGSGAVAAAAVVSGTNPGWAHPPPASAKKGLFAHNSQEEYQAALAGRRVPPRRTSQETPAGPSSSARVSPPGTASSTSREGTPSGAVGMSPRGKGELKPRRTSAATTAQVVHVGQSSSSGKNNMAQAAVSTDSGGYGPVYSSVTPAGTSPAS